MTTALATKVDAPHITFSVGIPGFPDAHTFVLVNNDMAQEPFAIMRCVEDESLEFVVVPPHLFFPDYAPEIDDATSERVGLESAGDALVLVIVTVGDELAEVTANLLGPIVVNRHTHEAAQAVLVNQGYELRTPLFDPEVISGSAEEAGAQVQAVVQAADAAGENN